MTAFSASLRAPFGAGRSEVTGVRAVLDGFAKRLAMTGVLVVSVVVALPIGSHAQPTPDALQAARELTQTIGSNSPSVQILEQLRGQLIASIERNARKPEGEAASITDELLMPDLTSHAGELDDTILTIYATSYSVEDLRALRQFYLTPLGQRVLKAGPLIGEQSFTAGRAWGSKAAREAIGNHADQLRERGVVL